MAMQSSPKKKRLVASLPDLVRRGRELYGLTQAELAERAQVGRELIIKLEQGLSTAPLDKTQRILNSLELDIAVVPLHRSPDPNNSTPTMPQATKEVVRQRHITEPPCRDPIAQGLGYHIADFTTLGLTIDAGAFYKLQYRPTLRAMVAFVIEQEAPIFDDVIATRIAQAHGFQQVGNQILKLVVQEIDPDLMTDVEGGRRIIWRKGMEKESLRFRIASNEVRGYGDIPLVELSRGVKCFVDAKVSREEIRFKMADLFGFRRSGPAFKRRIDAAIDLAQGPSHPPLSNDCVATSGQQ